MERIFLESKLLFNYGMWSTDIISNKKIHRKSRQKVLNKAYKFRIYPNSNPKEKLII